MDSCYIINTQCFCCKAKLDVWRTMEDDLLMSGGCYTVDLELYGAVVLVYMCAECDRTDPMYLDESWDGGPVGQLVEYIEDTSFRVGDAIEALARGDSGGRLNFRWAESIAQYIERNWTRDE